MVGNFLGYWQRYMVLYSYLARQPIYAMGSGTKIVVYEIFLDRADNHVLSFSIRIPKLSFMTKSSSAPGIFLFFLPFLKLIIYCVRTFSYFAPPVILLQ